MDRYVTDIKNGCYQNPVLPMDFSDPDAIRVGEDYYLISSSFTYLPGVPVLHSKDLVHWERIGNCVERLPFDRYAQPAHGCGTWAPALRYHAGRFYAFIPLPDEGIFYTEATDPAGPWSALHCVKSASGWIDPCPLWDDDGSVYMAHAFAKSRCGIKHKIQLSRLDPETLEVVEDGPIVFDGTLSQPTAEGPKMYKRNGWYYIFIPAGGVEYGWQTVLHGAPHALPDAATPVPSEGAELIIREAMKEDTRPLFVLLLGPLTDLASAYLQEPRIAGRLTAIWIGGAPYPVGGPEFNLGNDVNAVNVVFGSTMPVWQVPKNVYEMMPVSMAELEYRVHPQGAVGRYLFDQLVAYSQTPESRASAFRTGESWVLGDNPAPGLLLYEHRFQFDWVPAPYVTADQTYAAIGRNRPIRVYKGIDSRLILDDLYAKLALFAQYMAQKGE